MALTRSQLIAGDSSQGPVLPGQVQGVKQGDGVTIGPDGRISFLASTSQGVVKLNNTTAYNAYVWPNSSGLEGTFLGVDGNGNLSWAVPDGLVNLGEAPVDPTLGELWFSYSTNLLYVRQDKEGSESWKPVYQGLDPSGSNTSASPAFTGGDGTDTEPFIVESVTTRGGNTVLLPSTVTITGFAPYQYVPIYDIHGEENSYRFEPTSYFADETGTLVFKVKFTDYPQTAANEAYSATFRVGFESPIFIEAAVGITSPISIINPGSISGAPQVREVLSYTPGIAGGGTPPYQYSWVWKLESTNEVLQVDGSTYTVSPLAADDRIYVELTATDINLDTAVANTGSYPTIPALIAKGVFPNTTILFPTTTTSVNSTLWADAGTTLFSGGCIEFSIDGVSFSQGPTPIANGGTITTRWISSANCGGAPNSTTITGCVFSDSYRECSSLAIDKVPSPFLFNPVTDIIPGTAATSQTITPIGYNSVSYVTFNPSSTGSNIQASTDGGLTWNNLSTIGSTSVPLSPGETLSVRMTTGSSYNTPYTAIINLGSGASIQSSTFTATTSDSSVFNTPITFPTTTTSQTTTTWLSSDGSTSLTATGCIEFKVGVSGSWTGSGDPAVPITTGDVLYTRWSNDSPGVCGNAPHGFTITGSITNVPSGGTSTSVATLTIGRVPTLFSFSDSTGQAPSSVITSNTVNITGINAPSYITRGTSGSDLGSLEASVGGSAWTAIPASGETLSIEPQVSGLGTSLQIRGTTGASNNTTYSGIVNIGQGTSLNSDTWDVTTSSITPSIVTPSIVTPINGADNLNPNSSSPPGITITSSTYNGINGAGTHTGSDWEVYYLNAGTPVYAVQVSDSPTNLTSYFVPIANLLPGKTYFARVRYRTSTPSPILSNWSNLSQFGTAASFSLQWSVRLVPGVSGVGSLASATDPAPDGYTVFLGTGNQDGNRSYRTLDGITFSPGGNTNMSSITGLAYGGGRFVGVGIPSPSTNNNNICISTNDGRNWSQSRNPEAPLTGIAYSPTLNLFCAVASNGRIYTSPSGDTNWIQRTSPTSQPLKSILWDGTAFRACGGTAYISSTNGISWTLTTIATAPDGRGLGQIAYNPQSGRYFMTRGYEPIESAGTGSIYGMYSSNGTTWTSTTAPGKLGTVAAGGNWFVAGSTDPSSSVNVFTSLDGISWTESYVNNTYYHVHQIQYIPQFARFAFSAHNWVMISSV